MPNELIWTAVVVALGLLGLWKPRWLVAILCVAFVLAIVGFFGVFVLIVVGKFFGNRKD